MRLPKSSELDESQDEHRQANRLEYDTSTKTTVQASAVSTRRGKNVYEAVEDH